MAGLVIKPQRAAKRILRLTEGAKHEWPVSFTTDDSDLDDIANVAELRSIAAAYLVMVETFAHNEQGALILRAMHSSASFDGSAQRAARAWLRNDDRRRAAGRAQRKPKKAGK